ncbi:hypothetical protein N7508_002244 [Penicillium antarcticum]|uniref:uncharacterized protein n=1 Tax=Penicillium antarcticum TaxID=416450 RepID=UPI00238BCA9A|nr:uncharacterized protein N7508_002244 [Penicillium antarcticum]KAJ5317736.1 hypothetical protein N7508_002244 [Penicillium antarcticum]
MERASSKRESLTMETPPTSSYASTQSPELVVTLPFRFRQKSSERPTPTEESAPIEKATNVEKSTSSERSENLASQTYNTSFSAALSSMDDGETASALPPASLADFLPLEDTPPPLNSRECQTDGGH